MEVSLLSAPSTAPYRRGLCLTASDAEVRFGDVTALASISFAIAAGEIVGVVGPSGTGKSTLLAAIAGLQPLTSGVITVSGRDIARLRRDERARLRRTTMGLVSQSPDLLPELSVIENVAITLLFDGVRRADALRAARAALSQVDLDGLHERAVDELSGGQAQRVSLARALARPGMGLLLADEPTASLDASAAAEIAGLVVARARDDGVTTVVATHDSTVADRCDRVLHVGGRT